MYKYKYVNELFLATAIPLIATIYVYNYKKFKNMKINLMLSDLLF
jgi:hypothetical protein